MIDVSDGVATDIRHLAEESDVGFRLDAQTIPISDEASALSDSRSLLEHALTDGDDYELLFTVPADRVEAFTSAWAQQFELTCTCIGFATEADSGVELQVSKDEHIPLSATGYEHFS